MCGIVAVDIQDISSDQIEEVKRLLIETEIRGRHASGISWYANKKVNTIKAPVPVTELLEEFDIYRCVDDNNGHLAMIAHIRYSTSDLEFNQPIDGGDFAIAHNGVISQSPSDQWEEIFKMGVPTGKNDSELILMSHKADKHPLESFPEASMAVVTIDHLGHVHAYRNGKRPLWLTKTYNGWIATSTEDIVHRAKVEYSSVPDKAIPGFDYNLTTNSLDIIVKDMGDLQ